MEISDSELQIAIKEASYGNMTFDVLGMDWQMYSTDAFVPLSAFTSHMNGNGATFNNPETILRSNITAWSSDLYDSYMDSAYQSSGDTRTEYLKKAEELLVDSAVVIPVIYNQSFAYVHEDIDDLVVDGFGNFVWTEAELDDYEQYLN
jgi:ABC-type oligopeptide transport system substrate-binding subunit